MNIKLLKVGETLPINEELAGIVPLATEEEQEVLTRNIKENGLIEPIVLWRGKIVDGRCRQRACLATGKALMAKELDDELTEEDVKAFVKSANTRRNLTTTQKIMSACKASLAENSNRSVREIAKSWGVSNAIVINARHIAKVEPEIAEALFNGKSVKIVDSKGKTVASNKVSAIYAYLIRRNEIVDSKTEHGWKADSYILTQKGKDWYYVNVGNISDTHSRMLIAELANYKFPISESKG